MENSRTGTCGGKRLALEVVVEFCFELSRLGSGKINSACSIYQHLASVKLQGICQVANPLIFPSGKWQIPLESLKVSLVTNHVVYLTRPRGWWADMKITNEGALMAPKKRELVCKMTVDDQKWNKSNNIKLHRPATYVHVHERPKRTRYTGISRTMVGYYGLQCNDHAHEPHAMGKH